MSSIKEKIRSAKRPEKTEEICLRGDLQAKFEDLERQLEKAKASNADSLAGTGAIARQIEEVRQEMEEHSVIFRLRALRRTDWKDFIAEHPPRRNEDGSLHEHDRNIGVNIETMFPALIRISTVEPELDEEDWTLLLDEALTDNQFDTLWNAAWGLNRRDVDIPFSRAASRILSSVSE